MDNRPFVAIDFETANGNRASVCAIGMAKYDATGEKIDEYCSLVRPRADYYNFGWKNIELHGITAKDVENKPEWCEIVDEIRHFIGDLPLVAHSIDVDADIMQQVMELYGLKQLTNDWLCTHRIAKEFFEEKASSDLEKYWIGEQLLEEKDLPDSEESRIDKQSSKEEGSPGLKESLESLKKLDQEQGQKRKSKNTLFGLRNIYHYFSKGGTFKHHDASDDAEAAAFIFLKMREKYSYEDLKKYSEIKSRTNGKSKIKRPPKTQKSDSSSKKLDELKESYKDLEPKPLQGESICFTGTLDAGKREDLWKFAENLGAIKSENVTMTTTVLVCGGESQKKGTDKINKAEKLNSPSKDDEKIQKIQKIKIITESQFFEGLKKAKTQGVSFSQAIKNGGG